MLNSLSYQLRTKQQMQWKACNSSCTVSASTDNHPVDAGVSLNCCSTVRSSAPSWVRDMNSGYAVVPPRSCITAQCTVELKEEACRCSAGHEYCWQASSHELRNPPSPKAMHQTGDVLYRSSCWAGVQLRVAIFMAS